MFKAARHLALAATALAVFALGSYVLHAQGATALMFYGGTLPKPVIVSGADAATFNNITATASVPAGDLDNRPYIQVALFWGTRADPANNGTRLEDLKPEMAWQHGRFYPAVKGKPALLLTTELTKRAQAVPPPSNGPVFTWGGPVPPKALEVLQRLGIIR